MFWQKISALLATALAASTALAAEPAKTEGDAYQILGVALDLGSKCGSFAGFEYLYLAELWAAQETSSAANTAIAEARKKVSSAGGKLLQSQAAGAAVRETIAKDYRAKADKLGCEGGANYIGIGQIESYKQLGGLMAMTLAFRGPTREENSPLPPLSPDEAALVQAFSKSADSFFGDKRAQFDALLPDLARQRIATYPSTNVHLAMAEMDKDQLKVFSILAHEVLATKAGWTSRGHTLPDSTAFGYRTIKLSKSGAADLTLINTPSPVAIYRLSRTQPITGYMAIGLRPDGTTVVGLLGSGIGGAPTSLMVKAQSTGPNLDTVVGTLTTEGCPYTRCYSFPRGDIAKLVPYGFSPNVRFFATTDATAIPEVSKTDGQELEAEKLRGVMKL